jgi:hypothetical protein
MRRIFAGFNFRHDSNYRVNARVQWRRAVVSAAGDELTEENHGVWPNELKSWLLGRGALDLNLCKRPRQ